MISFVLNLMNYNEFENGTYSLSHKTVNTGENFWIVNCFAINQMIKLQNVNCRGLFRGRCPLFKESFQHTFNRVFRIFDTFRGKGAIEQHVQISFQEL